MCQTAMAMDALLAGKMKPSKFVASLPVIQEAEVEEDSRVKRPASDRPHRSRRRHRRSRVSVTMVQDASTGEIIFHSPNGKVATFSEEDFFAAITPRGRQQTVWHDVYAEQFAHMPLMIEDRK